MVEWFNQYAVPCVGQVAVRSGLLAGRLARSITRTSRALDNHKENVPLVLTAVVVVQLAGRANRVSAIAALVFVAARALHGVLFVAGITGLLTLAFVAGVLASFAIFAQLM